MIQVHLDLISVNAGIENRVCPMYWTDFALENVLHQIYLLIFDADDGYRRNPSDRNSESFSLITEAGVYTSTRLLQWKCDGVAVFQQIIVHVFSDLLHKVVLIRIGSIGGFGKTTRILTRMLKTIVCPMY